MKLRILVKLIEKLLGMTDHGDEPRADMYLPDRLLALAMVLLAGGIACGIYAAVRLEVWAIVVAVLGIPLGVAALMSWKNQMIHVLSEEEFAYTTMFGNRYTYRFADIRYVRANSDSMTVFVADKKVHIESMAVLSQRLVDLINQALKQQESA